MYAAFLCTTFSFCRFQEMEGCADYFVEARDADREADVNSKVGENTLHARIVKIADSPSLGIGRIANALPLSSCPWPTRGDLYFLAAQYCDCIMQVVTPLHKAQGGLAAFDFMRGLSDIMMISAGEKPLVGQEPGFGPANGGATLCLYR